MMVTGEQGIVAIGQDKNVYLCDWIIIYVLSYQISRNIALYYEINGYCSKVY
jgi:hypothetical protein